MPSIQTLALLPGLLCDAELWRHQVAGLSDLADCRVADLTRHDNFPAMARALLEDLPERFALAGLSMGGYVALEILRQAPERIERLALLDTSARADSPEQTARRKDLLALAERGQFKGVTPRLLPLLIHESRLAERALTDAVMAMADRVGPAAFLRQQTAIMQRPDSRPLLLSVDCPALVLCGRQDQLTPLEWHIEMAEALPDPRFEVIEDCGHLSTMERPEEVTAHLRAWLEA